MVVVPARHSGIDSWAPKKVYQYEHWGVSPSPRMNIVSILRQKQIYVQNKQKACREGRGTKFTYVLLLGSERMGPLSSTTPALLDVSPRLYQELATRRQPYYFKEASQNFRQCCGSGPGSGAFLTPGSGIRDSEYVFSGSRISDPKLIFLRA
jgi:hypothetical protein